jgi:hypothetical protein
MSLSVAFISVSQDGRSGSPGVHATFPLESHVNDPETNILKLFELTTHVKLQTYDLKNYFIIIIKSH